MEDERELVVLVDDEGQPIGAADKVAVHGADTPRHLAFSCYVFDRDGSFLVTQRALTKRVWPGVWSNSVCGHPAPDESFEAAIRRRLDDELGMTAGDFEVALPDYQYRSPPFDGIVENELCPVYVARGESEPRPNPSEVEAYRWMSWADFVRAVEADTADTYSWWSRDQLARLKDHSLIAAYSSPITP